MLFFHASIHFAIIIIIKNKTLKSEIELSPEIHKSVNVSLLFSVGNPITAVYAIPATRSGYSEYFVSTPPTSYHSPSWMSYPPEPEDVPPQWADSVRKPILLA